MTSYVIVGGGLAAASAAVTLREHGYEGRLEIHCAEPHPPYERPALSKGYLAGDSSVEKLFVRGADWYADHDVEVHLSSRVDRIEPDRRVVRFGEGEQHYDRLLLATGASPRQLAEVDRSAAPVTYLRTIEDSDRIRAHISPDQRLVVLGGGFLGLEVAASARSGGAQVTVLESQRLPLLGVLGREVAQVFAELHRDHGVDLRLDARVSGVEHVEQMALVRLAGGADVAADLLVVGVGALPNTDLAVTAGLSVGDGILVDDRLRSSDPRIYAAGDVANAWHPVLGRRVRVEHWQNAKAQGAVAARNMLGADESYTAQPYFFTDQYDLGMEYVGHVGASGYDELVLRGDVPGLRFSAFWLQDGVVAAAMHVNEWEHSDAIREAVGTRVPDAAALSDPAEN
jgi:3-phenylpropionate/trans-cinnamate dioxygenase ferredoxin reductase subunit